MVTIVGLPIPSMVGQPYGGGQGKGEEEMVESTLKFRRAEDRGVADHGWLRSRHTFSFADYYDPAWMGFRNLRVINDDNVAAGGGFPTHGHRDMEIVSYVLEGALEHKDSIGTGSIIRPGDVQRMSAGSGVRHSEYNASKTDAVHFLQIWIEPAARGIAPGYEQKSIPAADKKGRLALVASSTGEGGSVTIHADARIHAGVFGAGDRATFQPQPGRHTWIHVATGAAEVGGKKLVAGDAAFSSASDAITIAGDAAGGEVLVFDLA
jgi:quercetin 2,3-dioxygenase